MFARFELKQDWTHVAAWAGVDWTESARRFACAAALIGDGGHGRRLYPVVRISPVTKKRELVWMREGLIPSYACDDRGAGAHTEAHAEAIGCDPCFRRAFRRRRCFLPASILHERRHLSADIEQTCSFALDSGGLFAIAGVWGTGTNDHGDAVESFATITTPVMPLLRTLFDRMPVLLCDQQDRDRWLRVVKAGEHPPVDLLQPLSSAQLLRDWKMIPGAVDMHLERVLFDEQTEASILEE